jgi:hypothetical protein
MARDGWRRLSADYGRKLRAESIRKGTSSMIETILTVISPVAIPGRAQRRVRMMDRMETPSDGLHVEHGLLRQPLRRKDERLPRIRSTDDFC